MDPQLGLSPGLPALLQANWSCCNAMHLVRQMATAKTDGICEQRHHQLKKPIIDRQNTRILNLVQILLKSDLELEKSNGAIQNIMTGKVFSKETCEQVVSCEKVG